MPTRNTTLRPTARGHQLNMIKEAHTLLRQRILAGQNRDGLMATMALLTSGSVADRARVARRVLNSRRANARNNARNNARTTRAPPTKWARVNNPNGTVLVARRLNAD